MAEHGGQSAEAQNQRRLFQPASCKHHYRTLGNISQQGQQRGNTVAYAQYVGGTWVAGALLTGVSDAHRVAHHQRGRYRAEQVGQTDKHNFGHAGGKHRRLTEQGKVMDIVYIRGLQVETIIGIYDWERQVRQRIVLDLEMATDIRAAAASEDIEQTLDYNAIATDLREFITRSQFLLVETLAEEVAQRLMQEFRVPWLRVQVGKPGAVADALDVGVIIERGERG